MANDADDYDMEQYEFEYDTDDQEIDDVDIDIENRYFASKSEMKDYFSTHSSTISPIKINATSSSSSFSSSSSCFTSSSSSSSSVALDNVIESFRSIIELEKKTTTSSTAPNISIWSFKAMKQLCKILFSIGREEELLATFSGLLQQSVSVTRNQSEKVINKLLDFVSSNGSQQIDFLRRFFEYALTLITAMKNERLLFTTSVKLCRIYFQCRDFVQMQKILKDLYRTCEDLGCEETRRGTQLQEVYALEIQLCTELKHHKKLKELYTKSTQIKSAISHPRIMGIIRECGGKMHMSEGEWEKALTDFFGAFKNYDEAGHDRRIQCLKYLVLANMLAVSKINPFDSPEALPYKEHPEILAMTDLLFSYEQNRIKDFESILQSNRESIMGDSFIRLYIEDLLKTIRTQVLLNLIKPYTKITINFISNELNIPANDVETLLIGLILDNQIHGYIDQINQVLELKNGSISGSAGNSSKSSNSSSGSQYQALQHWGQHIVNLQRLVTHKLG